MNPRLNLFVPCLKVRDLSPLTVNFVVAFKITYCSFLASWKLRRSFERVISAARLSLVYCRLEMISYLCRMCTFPCKGWADVFSHQPLQSCRCNIQFSLKCMAVGGDPSAEVLLNNWHKFCKLEVTFSVQSLTLESNLSKNVFGYCCCDLW